MLVGTALGVILPEGVEMLYDVNEGRVAIENVETDLEKRDVFDVEERELYPVKEDGRIENHTLQSESHSHSHSSFSPHHYIGPSLTLGFVLMFLIDNLSHHTHSHSQIVTITDLPSHSHSSKSSATIGLVVHAAADGIALGAASASSLSLIIFLAIMLHKAPSAFGLATFLLAENHSRKTIRKHLLIFSLAAPIAALFTYTFLYGYGNTLEDMGKWTGILLLFSAGTFLYVATVHILPEIYERKGGGKEGRLTLTQVGCLLGGIFAPLLLAVEHGH